MIFLMFLILLTTANIIFFTNRKSLQARWTSLFMLCGSVGAFAYVISEQIIPFLQNWNFPKLIRFLLYLRIHFNFVTEIVTPYAVIMFSVVASDLFKKPVHRVLMFAFLIPVLFMYTITPFSPETYVVDFPLALYWIVPYYVFSSAVLLISYFKAEEGPQKKNRLITALICIPSLMSVLFFDSIAKAINPDTNLFRLVPVFITYSFIVFLVSSFFSGALGVKMRFEQHVLDNTMKAVSSGTNLLSHSIKNQIYKIHASLHVVKSYGELDDPAYREALDIIDRSSTHLVEMVEKIRSQSDDILLFEEVVNLSELLDRVVADEEKVLQQRNICITFRRLYPERILIVCDPNHIVEVMHNIVRNAIEAFKDAGQIIIKAEGPNSTGLTISISDNGPGIKAENLKAVFDPFFTTKASRGTNFGLGLSYCYNVMLKSGGSLEISSEIKKGTTVKVIFPKSKTTLRHNPKEAL